MNRKTKKSKTENQIGKRERIMNAMQELLTNDSSQNISVNDIAKKAGIGKGSIYYYFASKNDILDAIIERAYSRVLDEGQRLAQTSQINAIQKMEIIHRACMDSTIELHKQEAYCSLREQQEDALIHQKFARVIISRLKPILTDIIRQGIAEGSMHCDYPEETAQIILTELTIILGNNLLPVSRNEIVDLLKAFSTMQEASMGITPGSLHFLLR